MAAGINPKREGLFSPGIGSRPGLALSPSGASLARSTGSPDARQPTFSLTCPWATFHWTGLETLSGRLSTALVCSF
jgi:hypothetical protein